MKKVFVFLVTLVFVLSPAVWADNDPGDGHGGGGGGATLSTYQSFNISPADVAASIYNLLFPVGIAMGIFGVVSAGYAYMTSQGDPRKLQEAGEKMTSALLGMLFIILSLVIIKVIINVLL